MTAPIVAPPAPPPAAPAAPAERSFTLADMANAALGAASAAAAPAPAAPPAAEPGGAGLSRESIEAMLRGEGEEGETGEGGAAAATEGTPTDAAPAPTFGIEVPLPPGQTVNGAPGVLRYEFPNQEAADVLKFHVKRSAQYQTLEAQLTQYQDDASTISFLNEHPLEGFAWLAGHKPQSAQRFIAHFAKANPEVIAELLKGIGYEVTPTAALETIDARAKLAQREFKDLLAQSLQAHTSQASAQSFTELGATVIADLADTMQLGEPESLPFQVFAQTAARLLDQKFPRGARREEMELALQPLVRDAAEFLRKSVTVRGTAAPAAPLALIAPTNGAAPAASPADRFAATAAQGDRFRKLADGTTVVEAVGTSKQAATETLDQLIHRLGGG